MTEKPIPIPVTNFLMATSTATSTLDKTTISTGEAVTLTYNIDEPKDKDWVAYYCSDDLDNTADEVRSPS